MVQKIGARHCLFTVTVDALTFLYSFAMRVSNHKATVVSIRHPQKLQEELIHHGL